MALLPPSRPAARCDDPRSHISSHGGHADRSCGSVASHRIVGYDNFASHFNPSNDQLRFWLTLSLNGGLIDTFFNTPVTVTSFASQITHGSGRFRGIHGTMHARIHDNGRVVYTLKYSP